MRVLRLRLLEPFNAFNSFSTVALESAADEPGLRRRFLVDDAVSSAWSIFLLLSKDVPLLEPVEGVHGVEGVEGTQGELSEPGVEACAASEVGEGRAWVRWVRVGRNRARAPNLGIGMNISNARCALRWRGEAYLVYRG